MFDWNDLKYLLAVARQGTTLGASRELRVSQSTVARRVQALEEALGLELFDKRQSGYVLTELGEKLRGSAEAIETAMGGFAAEASAHKRGLAGSVRLTTNETFANLFLVRAIREFREAYPNVGLEIVTADKLLDLAQGEADVALRAGTRPVEPDLVGRRLAVDRWSVYCSREYAAQHGIPRSAEDFHRHHVVSADGLLSRSPLIDWVEANVPPDSIVMRQNSISGLYASIKGGIGVSMMSDFVAIADPDLVHCFTPEIEHQPEVWIVTHERLRGVPRVRAVLDFLTGYFATGLYRDQNRPGAV